MVVHESSGPNPPLEFERLLNGILSNVSYKNIRTYAPKFDGISLEASVSALLDRDPGIGKSLVEHIQSSQRMSKADVILAEFEKKSAASELAKAELMAWSHNHESSPVSQYVHMTYMIKDNNGNYPKALECLDFISQFFNFDRTYESYLRSKMLKSVDPGSSPNDFHYVMEGLLSSLRFISVQKSRSKIFSRDFIITYIEELVDYMKRYKLSIINKVFGEIAKELEEAGHVGSEIPLALSLFHLILTLSVIANSGLLNVLTEKYPDVLTGLILKVHELYPTYSFVELISKLFDGTKSYNGFVLLTLQEFTGSLINSDVLVILVIYEIDQLTLRLNDSLVRNVNNLIKHTRETTRMLEPGIKGNGPIANKLGCLMELQMSCLIWYILSCGWDYLGIDDHYPSPIHIESATSLNGYMMSFLPKSFWSTSITRTECHNYSVIDSFYMFIEVPSILLRITNTKKVDHLNSKELRKKLIAKFESIMIEDSTDELFRSTIFKLGIPTPTSNPSISPTLPPAPTHATPLHPKSYGAGMGSGMGPGTISDPSFSMDMRMNITNAQLEELSMQGFGKFGQELGLFIGRICTKETDSSKRYEYYTKLTKFVEYVRVHQFFS